MHGLVSLLPTDYYAQVEELWHMLEYECGLTGIKVTPFPHFSWLIGEDFDWKALESTLAQLARETKPITVNSGGIGVFSGPNPVIFIPIVRTDALNALHKRIWDAIQPIGIDLSPYYAPQFWMPHISLAYEDVTQENIHCAMQKLAFQTFSWKFDVNNISFIHEPEGAVGKLYYQFDFTGK